MKYVDTVLSQPDDGLSPQVTVAAPTMDESTSNIATPVAVSPAFAFASAQGVARQAVSVLADGGLVVSWTDRDSTYVTVQRFDTEGNPYGDRLSPFEDYEHNQDRLPYSVVAGWGNEGGFVVAATLWFWHDVWGPVPNVVGRKYTTGDDTAPRPVGLSGNTKGNDNPAAATLPDGSAVFVWEDWWRDGSESSIYATRFNSDGSGTHSFPVNTYGTDWGYQWDPTVAALTGGGFVVTWTSMHQDGDGGGIYGQRYASDNSRDGGEFRVNTTVADDQVQSRVAGLTDGGFVVTWTQQHQNTVYGQRFAADGAPAGPEFVVGYGGSSAVEALPDGGFLITRATTGSAIHGQRYAWDGLPIGEEFLVAYGGYDTDPIVGLDDGSFLITWASSGRIFAQRYELPASAAPTAILLNGESVTESAPAGTIVGIATAVDPDVGDSFSWSLIDDAGGRFAIDPATGMITTTMGLDYETAASHEITVRVFDAVRLYRDATFTIDVEDVTVGDWYAGTAGDDIIAYPEVGSVDAIDGGAGFDRLIVTAAAVTMAPTADGTGLYFELDGIDGSPADGTVDRVLTARNVEEVETRAESATVSGDFAQTGLRALSYLGGDTADILDASGVTSPLPIHARGSAGADMLIGGAGVETADYSASNGRVTVSLTSGNGWYGHAAGDTLSGIENVIGSTFDDALKGDSGANRLESGNGDDTLDGQPGNDVLAGGAGADRLLGGAGVDTADYSASTGRVTVSLMSGSGWAGHASGDRLTDVENAIGSAFDDSLKGTTGANRLEGGAGNDTLDGQAGNDVLAGGAGADRLLGGAGVDTADYSASTGRVTVSLMSGSGWSGHASGDTLDSIENLVGSAFDDSLKGTTGANRLEGGAGDDTLDGQAGNDVLAGVAGTDRLLGGAGIDTADYSGSTGRVTVSLMSGNGWYGHASGDTLDSIESVVGSAFDDSLKGDGGANRLEGGAGADTLDGQNGNDVLIGGAGADRLTGGGGNDIFMFGNGVGDDTITDFVTGAGRLDAIDLSANSLLNGFADVLAHSSQAGLDTLINLGGGDLLTLLGVTRTNLHQDDFVF